MKALVTGATGFLGAWTTRKLMNEGLDVRIICRPTSDMSEIAGLKVERVAGDVTDLPSLQRACQGVDVVFHLAGVVGYSRAQRDMMEKVNVQGTQNVVEACLGGEIKKLVHVSSVVAIGASFDGRAPLNENSKFNLSHLDLGYFETKRKGEEIVVDAVKTKSLDAVILNPSTIYGAGDAKKGSRKMQLKVARGQFPFYTSGGVSIVAVEDVVQGIWSAFQKGRRGERYILSGENVTIQNLFQLIADEAGVSAPSWYLPNPVVKMIGKVGDQLERMGKKGPLNSENAWTAILYHWFDSSKAQRELDFKPRSAELAIRSSIAWTKANGLL